MLRARQQPQHVAVPFLYLPAVSPGQYLLRAAGLSEIDLMGSRTIYIALVNIAVWGGVGFNMLVSCRRSIRW